MEDQRPADLGKKIAQAEENGLLNSLAQLIKSRDRIKELEEELKKTNKALARLAKKPTKHGKRTLRNT